MAKHGGYPGGMIPGNMGNLMKQAQRMQAKVQEQQAALEEKEYTAQAGGGAVTVVLTGKKTIKSVTISPEVVDPDDVEMLQDLVMVAVNDALKQMEDSESALMSGLTKGMGGLF